MITSFSLGNFKAFSSTQDIPLKPITLIFGPNSSGKSSIIHALMLAQLATTNGTLDMFHSSRGGDSIDLGGFRNYIHKHNTENIMEFAFKCEHVKPIKGKERGKQPKLENCEYCIQIGLPSDDNGIAIAHSSPEIKSLTISKKGKKLLQMSTKKGGVISVDTIALDAKLNKDITPLLKSIGSKKNHDLLMRLYKLQFYRKGLVPHIPIDAVNIMEMFSKLLLSISEIEKAEKNQSKIELPPDLAAMLDDSVVTLWLTVLVSMIGPVHNELQQFGKSLKYLGPMRTYPPRHISGSKYNDPNWYAGGGYAWDVIRTNKDVRDRVNQWLISSHKLNSRYQLTIREMGDIDQLETPIIKQLSETDNRNVEINEFESTGVNDQNNVISGSETIDFLDIEEIAKKTIRAIKDSTIDKLVELVLTDVDNGVVVSHRDIGFGVSQVLPILAYSYAYNQSLIAIEQPEIHLHPALQSELGDVFIESALGENKNRFVIETHSEHLILRLLRRIRETSEGTLKDKRYQLKPQDIAVLWVCPSPNGSTIKEIPVTTDGDFLEKWPSGFFTEREEELF